jgi:putative CocE/NonD family hydrolase
VQWAVAGDADDDLAALVIQGSASQFHGQSFPGGSMSLETSAQWLVMIALQESCVVPLPMAVGLARLHRLLSRSSLEKLDELVTGGEVAWFREARASPQREDDYWVRRDFSAGVPEVKARVNMITGWQDSFTPWQLEDYISLQEADRPRQLIIGPWTHNEEGLGSAGVREGLAWLRANLLGDDRLIDAAPVRLFVTGDGAKEWRRFERWPPDESTERPIWIAGSDSLAWQPPEADGGRRYRYDPADPTPSLGGPIMITLNPVRDNRKLEARPDVVTFTGPALEAALEAIGPVRVELWARASEPYFDLFARVCDVDPRGRSWNVCDALASVAPGRFEHSDEDDAWRVQFDLWPIAHRFASGHRIRLQVSSGAHPRYVRNPGTGEDPLTARTLRAVDVEILYGPAHPSSLVLPVFAER